MKTKLFASLFILIAALQIGAAANSPAAAQPREAALPRVFLLDAQWFAQTRQKIRGGDKDLLPALNTLKREADADFKLKPYFVINKSVLPPSGDKHDYMSQAPYFWPNPKTTNGLPYIRRDGERNPEIQKIPNHGDILTMPEKVQTLAMAWYFTGDETYAAKAVQLLRAWFLDPATRMNPNFEFAQFIPSVNTGRGTGLIESRGLVHVVDAVGLLAGSKSWTKADDEALKQWFAEFAHWMQTSKNGRAEADAKNNHGTYYDIQIVSFELFLGETNLAKQVVSEAREKRIAVQIEPDGSQPLELARTRAWSYSVANLGGLMSLADLGKCVGVDLWNYQTSDGRSIRKALDFLMPFALEEKEWPYQQLGKWPPEALFPLLRRASVEFQDAAYVQHLPPYSDSPWNRHLKTDFEKGSENGE